VLPVHGFLLCWRFLPLVLEEKREKEEVPDRARFIMSSFGRGKRRGKSETACWPKFLARSAQTAEKKGRGWVLRAGNS